MKRALLGLAITLFVIASHGCLIDRGAIHDTTRADASVDAPPDPGDTGLVCEGEERVCGARCVNPRTDAMHCGGCDMPCDPGQACVGGECTGCMGPTVYGVCAPGLRAWFDARDPLGDGTGGTLGTLARWSNLALTETGDATPTLGAPTLVDGAGGRRAVRFEGSALTTRGVISGAGMHAEIFLVARTRSITPGVALATSSASGTPLTVELPGDKGYVFAMPGGEPAQTMTGPFGRDTRHTTLWHAFSGPTGGEVRIDGTVVARGGTGVAAPVGAPLLIGASDDGRAQTIDISEVLVFDLPLSASDRSAITAALLDRWGLGSPAMPAADDLSLWLDARRPLRDEDVADGTVLARWDDRSTRATMATTVRATYRADGFGGGRAAVELGGVDDGESSVTFPRPVSGDLTALVVFSTDDGTGEGEGWNSASLLGADARFAVDDGGIVLAGGHVGFGRETTMRPSSRGRVDDGELHVLVARRTAADGLVRIWVDHEEVVSGATLVGAVSSPASWFLGRHPDAGEGSLAARYGEVLVYARALDDEELTTTERYLVRRWSAPPAGSQPPLVACTPGSRLACPVRSLAELRSAATGTYWIDVGAGPHRVSIDSAEGGGWALVLQYVRSAGTLPERDVIAPGEDWPASTPTALAGGESVRSARWGHVSRAVAASLGATELRFFGATTGHARIVHFATPVGLDGWREGRNTFAGVETRHTLLGGHTGRLPASSYVYAYGMGDEVLTDFPLVGATESWGVGSAGRWEMDDLPLNGSNGTIHRVWAR